MDDQQNDKPEEMNEQPQDSAPESAEPQVQGAADTSGDETPDAVKAAGDVMIGAESGSEADAETDDSDTIDASTVKDPTMDLPREAVDEAGGDDAQAHPAEFPQFGEGAETKVPRNINLLMDVKLPVSIELGRTTLPIGEILEWGQGSIIELDRLAGEPVDLMVNNKLVAKGEVVVVDEKFGLRITSLMSPRERLETL